MKQKITDLKVEQVPCKKEGFKEFKITYKYKGKEITDFKAYDTELFPDTLDHEFYRMAVRETNKRCASGKLARYAIKFLHPKLIPLAIACASIAVVSAAVIPTAVVLSKSHIEPDPEVTTIVAKQHYGAGNNVIALKYTLGDNINKNPATVDWGDGSDIETLNNPEIELTHTYEPIASGETKEFTIIFSGDVSSVSTGDAQRGMHHYIVSLTFSKWINKINTSFKNLSMLKSVYIPSTITDIDTEQGASQPFYGASSLEKIHVNRGNKKYYSDNKDAALIEKNSKILITGTTQAYIDNKVKEIGSYAYFATVNNFESIVIPPSVTRIRERAFSNNSTNLSELSSVTFNSGLKVIDSHAFFCSSISELNLPNTLTEIGAFAFASHNSVTSPALSVINIPDSVKKIGDHAFEYQKKLKTLKMSQGVESIGDYAFRRCDNMEGMITLPTTLTSIGTEAFALENNQTIYKNVKFSIKILNPELNFTGNKTFNYCWYDALVIYTCHLYVPFADYDSMAAKWGDPNPGGTSYDSWMGYFFTKQAFAFNS